MKQPADHQVVRAVVIGSTWRRSDPSGTQQTFEVTCFSKNIYGQRCCKGRTPSGKLLTLDILAMENGDPRFEHIHDRYVKRTA
jgi:hypothetical protein